MALELSSMVMIVESAWKEKICTRIETCRFLCTWKVKVEFHFTPSLSLCIDIHLFIFTEFYEELGEGHFLKK
jgi:hypothetical protein